MDQIPIILGGLILAGILWLLKGTAENGKTLAVLQSTIETHVMPELKRLRDSGHEVRGIAQGALSSTELHEQRLDRAEQEIRDLWNGEERRVGVTDRRLHPT